MASVTAATARGRRRRRRRRQRWPPSAPPSSSSAELLALAAAHLPLHPGELVVHGRVQRWRGRRGAPQHLALHRRQLVVHLTGTLQGLEAVLQAQVLGPARELPRDLGLALQGLHLLLHAVEGVQPAVAAHVGQHVVHLGGGLGGARAGHQLVLLGLGLRDLGLQLGHALVQLAQSVLLRVQLRPDAVGGVLVLGLPGKRLAGQLVVTLLNGQLRPLVPLLGGGLGGAQLLLKPLAAGGDLRVGLPHLHQVPLHVGHRLLQHLLRILHLVDKIIQVRLSYPLKPLKHVHVQCSRRRPGNHRPLEFRRRCNKSISREKELAASHHQQY
mmetsp:Transcript_30679/g.48262  ORF Transcript_30679/g.48262 Transcript_30679/m.48262 type:complete len:327 (+) Transcript_30679:302-1282(+)